MSTSKKGLSKPKSNPESSEKRAIIKGESQEEKAERARRLYEEGMKTASEEIEFDRKVKGSRLVWHDLYTLEVAEPKRNISWNKNPDWEKIPHKHFFHTVDSDGKKQKYSTAANGHVHEIVVKGVDEDGKPIVECGPAKVISRKRVFNLDESKFEQHTHEVSYRKSEQVVLREYSKEFLKQQSAIEADMMGASKKPAGLQ